MPEPNVKGLIYSAAATLPVGIALFVGGVVCIAVKHVVLGGVLMGLGVASIGAGCAIAMVMISRLRAYNRGLQAGQRGDLGGTFRSGRLP